MHEQGSIAPEGNANEAAFFVAEPKIFVVSRPEKSDQIPELLAFFNSSLKDPQGATPAEHIVEIAGRVCYLSFQNPSAKTTRSYIENLIRQGHESVLEHVSWTVVLAGVSRAFTHQLVRHRVGFAYSQLSQQYVDHRSVRFVIPGEILSQPRLLARWKRQILVLRKQYIDLLDGLQNEPRRLNSKENNRFVRSGARSILPNCVEAIIAVTGNARAFRHFLTLRGSIEGDVEMRRVSAIILASLKQEAPSIFFDFVQEDLPDGWPMVRRALSP